jgi:hypothetical protein
MLIAGLGFAGFGAATVQAAPGPLPEYAGVQTVHRESDDCRAVSRAPGYLSRFDWLLTRER